jgi:nucleoside-diphosphate-sugar epimerase
LYAVPDFSDVMVKGTWVLADAAIRGKVRRIINISSIAISGDLSPSMQRLDVDQPPQFLQEDLPYRLAKAMGEQILDAHHQAYGLDVIHLRPGVIAGDGMNTGPLRPANIDDTMHWFVYVDPRDVAHAIECAISTDQCNGRYHIVADRPDTLFDCGPAQRDLRFSAKYNWPELNPTGGPLDAQR